jgi:pyrroline-5-carboxylate reductase
MAAGLTMRTISDIVGEPIPIIRIMPNTPVAIGTGMTVYCYNDLVSNTILKDFLCDMSATGRMDQLPENLIDAASALSGSGPAYLYMFIEAMADGAVLCGIPRAKALEYAAATIAGAAQLMLEGGQHPAVLKDAVCSPGGSTIAGLRVLENHSFRGIVMECISAAYHRNKELGKK